MLAYEKIFHLIESKIQCCLSFFSLLWFLNLVHVHSYEKSEIYFIISCNESTIAVAYAWYIYYWTINFVLLSYKKSQWWVI